MAQTLVCFYVGTVSDFAADSASASSNLGTFYPGSSSYTSLNQAITAGVLPASCTPTAFRENVPNALKNQNNLSGSVTKSGYMWTLYTAGIV